jgi:hypothetical protein
MALTRDFQASHPPHPTLPDQCDRNSFAQQQYQFKLQEVFLPNKL